MKKILLASAGALAICAALSGPALAGDVAGTLSGSYASDTDNSGDLWNVNGTLTGKFGGNWGLEATGGYHNLSDNSGFGTSLDIWNVGGSAFWAMEQGRIAATVNYYHTDILGVGLNVTNYGAGGEFYAGPQVTIAVKGGGNNVDLSGVGNDNGGYVGGMLQWYVMPNLSLSGSFDYADIKLFNTTSETLKAEWLFSEQTPISIYGGYQHVEIGNGGGDGNLFFVGLKFYMNGNGGGALVDRQRNGSLGYIAEAPVLGLSTN
ncbi:MAG TPA: hypothetical protein VG889_12805 [Rhizomicrobium sp.]|nr:hypothetical protein [Rhizomicrobium sp.]